MLQRRAILAALTTSMAAALVPGSAIAAGLSAGNRMATPTSLREQLQALQGQDFHFEDETGETSQARLIAVEDGPRCPGLEQFSVVFEGERLSEGMNDLSHPEIGNMPIGLTSSECTHASRTRKRAHFSLITDKSFERLA
jgi:hypothetical protein